MAQNNFIQLRNLTTNTIGGTITITRPNGTKEEFAFGELYSDGNVTIWFQMENLEEFDCAVTIEGAPHNGTATCKGIKISGGTNAYFILNVTQNGYVNMFPTAPASVGQIV